MLPNIGKKMKKGRLQRVSKTFRQIDQMIDALCYYLAREWTLKYAR